MKTDFLPSATAGTGGLFIAGTNAATTVTTSFTTTFTGNLTGSVASVTGRRLSPSVGTGSFAANSITAAATASDYVAEITAAVPTAAQNATELLDQAAGVETGLTVRQALRLSASALFGKASGLATTTAIYRDFGDTKARLTATVDADGNRTAITRDAT